MNERLTQDGVRTILMPFGWKAVFFICFFLAAGRMDIPRAWIFLGMDYLGVIVVSVVFLEIGTRTRQSAGHDQRGDQTLG